MLTAEGTAADFWRKDLQDPASFDLEKFAEEIPDIGWMQCGDGVESTKISAAPCQR